MLRLTVLVFLWGVLLSADIFSDVAGFLSSPFKTVKQLSGKVWASIKHVIVWAKAVFRNVGAAWGDLHSAFRTLISGLESLAEGTYSAIRNLTNTLVPKWVRKAVSDSIDWAERNIKNVAAAAKKLAGQVKTWAVGEFNTVRHLISTGVAAVRKIAQTAITFIKEKGNWLWDTVRHPAKLVTWILPSLVTPLLRYIRDHLEAVSTLILRWAFSNPGKWIGLLERALSKVL